MCESFNFSRCFAYSVSLAITYEFGTSFSISSEKGRRNFDTNCMESVDCFMEYQFSSVQFSRSVMSDSLRPQESQHTRPPCPSPTPGVYPNSCPSSWWCHPAISSSVVPFSSCPQSLLASGSFPMNQLFAWGGWSIGVSALTSVLPMNNQDWFSLGWTDWTSLLSKGLSRVFSNTTVQKHQFSVLSFLHSPTLTSNGKTENMA